MRHFSVTDLKTYLDSGKKPLLLDVREPWEFEICHLANSLLLPMRQIPAEIETLEPHQEIVVICHHGIRSRQVGYFLERTGFTQIINLTGGVQAWAREIDNQMPTY